MVDIVVLWVDGADPEWLNEYSKYKGLSGDQRASRFRDWENLRYWFRGIERYAPWADKIHFVTWGHLPQWLNTASSKLNIVNHRDFIPKEYLPTFNSHTIELNIHRIQGLADQFIYFNDDNFIIAPVSEKRFFRNGLPCDMAVSNVLSPNDNGIDGIIMNNLVIINRHFEKSKVLKKNRGKWFNPRYKSQLYRTFVLYPWRLFTGFVDPHMPNAYLKSTFSEVWKAEPDILDNTCKSRFRECTNVNQYLLRYWRLCKGEFSPYNVENDSAFYQIQDSNIDAICQAIEKREKKVIGISDVDTGLDFEAAKTKIIASLDRILPEKSSFEL